ncbi:hypothetical protein THOM_2320 [Trachipleistophora hominis]|uniref:Uncharacterized protein n=1 Tax=Trachipleistophora hominis TaxID=72359 RepID=L7JTM4_TRAHO|nr:hypothetical protein THOM_2320 [Trachipleistophora hominis]
MRAKEHELLQIIDHEEYPLSVISEKCSELMQTFLLLEHSENYTGYNYNYNDNQSNYDVRFIL